MPAPARRALDALWRLDVTFASALAGGRERMVSRIRLAWWREALEKLDREAAPPEPVLQALQAHVLPAGIGGAELAAMEEGWAALLEDPLSPDALARFASLRGGTLFALSARLLGLDDPRMRAAGMQWALVDLARHSSNPIDARAALEEAGRAVSAFKWPRPLRPLGMLSMLASRDRERGPETWERPGAPARMLRMVRHRLTGT